MNSFGNKYYYLNGDPHKRKLISAVDLDNSLGYCPQDKCWYRLSRLLPYPLKDPWDVVAMSVWGSTRYRGALGYDHFREYYGRDPSPSEEVML